MPPLAAMWHFLDTIELRSALQLRAQDIKHRPVPGQSLPSSDPDQAGWSQRLLEAEEAGPAPGRRRSAGQHLHGDMTSDPNTGQSHCSGLQLSPGRAALRRAFTGPETRRAETEQEDTSSRLRPRPRQSWSHLTRVGPPPQLPALATSSYPRPGARDSHIARATLLIKRSLEKEYLAKIIVTNQGKIVQENNWEQAVSTECVCVTRVHYKVSDYVW